LERGFCTSRSHPSVSSMPLRWLEVVAGPVTDGEADEAGTRSAHPKVRRHSRTDKEETEKPAVGVSTCYAFLRLQSALA
jgi:hypothetical protein